MRMPDVGAEAGLDAHQMLEYERLKVFQTVLEMICSASMDAVAIIDRMSMNFASHLSLSNSTLVVLIH